MASYSQYLNQEQEEKRCCENVVVTPDKATFAADESTGSMETRLASIGRENTEDNRRKYRQLLFTAGADLNKYISGVMMFHETFYQKTDDGTPFAQQLDQKIVPRVEAEKDLIPLAATIDEGVTMGLLDDLNAAQHKKLSGNSGMSSVLSYLDENLRALLQSQKKDDWMERTWLKVESRTGLQRERLSMVLAVLAVFYVLLGGLLPLIVNLVGFLYPACASVHAMRDADAKAMTRWLTYWIVFGVFSLLDHTVSTFFPFYLVIKASVLVYMYLPALNGIIVVAPAVDPLLDVLANLFVVTKKD